MKNFIKKQRITNLDLVDGSFKQPSVVESSGVQHPQALREYHQSDQKKHTSQAVNSSMDSIEEEFKPNSTVENINSKQIRNSPILSSLSENLNLSIHPFNQRVESLSSNRRIQQQDSQIGKDMQSNRNIFPQESQFLQFSQNQDMNWLNTSQLQNNQTNSSFLQENNSIQHAQKNRIINLPQQNCQLSYESQRQSNNYAGQIFNNNFPFEPPFTQQNSMLSTQMTLKESQEQNIIEIELKQEIAEELQSVKKYFETAIKNEVASFSQNYSISEEAYNLILKNLTNRIEQTVKIVNNFSNNLQKKNKKKKQISQKYVKEILKLKEIIKKTELAVAEQSQNLIIGSTKLINYSSKTIRTQILKAKVSLKKQLRDQRKYSILSEKRKKENRSAHKI